MRKTLISVSIVAIALSGCHECPKVPVHETTTKCSCPKFNTRLSIKVKDLNSTHGAISWGDVSKIESFLKSKKKFNKHVDNINTTN